MGIPEERAGRKILNANDIAGKSAFQEEKLNHILSKEPERDAGMESIKLNNAPKQYAKGGNVSGYTLSDMKALASEAGFKGRDADKMAALAMVESSGNPGAENHNGEDSYGLTQINARAHGAIAKEALNPKRAFELAKMVFDKQGWGAWKNSLGPAAQYLNGETIVADAAPRNRSKNNLIQEESKPSSVLDSFLIADAPEGEDQPQAQESPHQNMLETITAAPWANPETKFAAKHILAESA